MSNFNFGSVATISTNTSSNRLRAWNIYNNVKFDGISEPLTGDTKDGGKWKAWDFTFSCPEGIYVERVFEPNEKSTERRVVTNSNGHESQLPSDFERILYFASQLVETFAPSKVEKYKEACAKIKTFDQFIQILQKVLDKSEVTTSLLLAGRNNNGTVYASLPTYVRINSKTNEPFTSERFVGDNLMFSAYELKQKEQYESAKPTNMEKVVTPNIETKKDDDIDFDDLI